MTTTDEKANAFELLTSIRAAGWMVGAHNDYRINGVPMTFWLFTHPSGQWVKGEGMTDLQALEEAAHEAAITMDAPLRFAEPNIAPNPTDSTLPALAVISLSAARAALAAVARWRRGDGPGDAFTHSDFGKRLEEALQRVRAWLGIDVEPDGTVSCPQHVDLHLQFAAAIFAKPISEITSDERLRTKRAGYFLAYGGAVEKAAAELGVPVERITAAMATHLPPVDHVVLASDSFGDGRAVWWDGDAISVFIENDSMLASDMKLGEVPPGISIWEGAFRFTGEASEAIPAPVGVFRAPTDSEWTAIRAGLSPWGS